MSGIEDAARSGVGHLTQFVGTDTLPAIRHAKRYYDATGLIGISVPATEHAVTSNNIISIENELIAGTYEYACEEQIQIMVNMATAGEETRLIAEVMFVYDLITRIVPNGIVSNVSDTYDFWAMMTRGYPYLKDVIMRRDPLGLQPGKVVVRPDSGDPVLVICGMKPVSGSDGKAIDFESEEAAYDFVERDGGNRFSEYKQNDCIKIAGVFYDFSASDDGAGIDTDVVYPYEVVAGAIRTLYKTFGGTITETGHKLLDSHIGLIYGDSITTKRALEILMRLEEQGYAAANVVFGVGSYTYQCVTRDVFGFAVKATNSIINGDEVAIFKDPKTDSKKKSAKGRLYVGEFEFDDGTRRFELSDNVTQEVEERPENKLELIYRDGKFLKRVTLDEIRQRSL
jgi:Nicotinic acid phosphoribosyltransferase